MRQNSGAPNTEKRDEAEPAEVKKKRSSCARTGVSRGPFWRWKLRDLGAGSANCCPLKSRRVSFEELPAATSDLLNAAKTARIALASAFAPWSDSSLAPDPVCSVTERNSATDDTCMLCFLGASYTPALRAISVWRSSVDISMPSASRLAF